MSVKKLSPSALRQWVEAVIARQPVYAPQAKGDRFDYDLLKRADDLRLDYDVTLLPPKRFILPPRETLLTFKADGTFEPTMERKPFVLFGVHPYDVIAIKQMDRVFSSDPPDLHYLARRESAAIVACDVQRASPDVFAGCMGTATVKDGFDILLTLVNDDYLVDARTPKGEALLKEAPDLQEADAVSLGRREQVWKDAERFLRKHELRCRPDDLPALLEKSWEHPLWKKRSELCYSCGSCVLVCPTCFCFDVQDEVDYDLASGRRVRQWDSCQLPDFAVVAGNHNFRKLREERYRHRFYRKAKYLSDRYEFIACVGCGRCAAACTTKIANPVEVFNTLLEDRP